MARALLSLINNRGALTEMTDIPDLVARLRGFRMAHPSSEMIEDVYLDLAVDRPPTSRKGDELRYNAVI